MRILKLLFSKGWHVLTHSTCLLLEHINSVFIFHLQLFRETWKMQGFEYTWLQKHLALHFQPVLITEHLRCSFDLHAGIKIFV